MKTVLNTVKISNELDRLGKTRTWLAGKLGISRQNMSDILRRAPISKADSIAQVLGFDPKDLLTTVWTDYDKEC